MSSGRKNDTSGAESCLIYAILGVICMPLVGIYMMIKGNSEQKIIGILLTIIGIIIWVYLGIK